MRVAVVGNQDNNGYRLTLWMRDAGADAHLYVMQRESGPRGSLEAIGPEVRDANGKLPDWIHSYDDDSAWSLYGKGALCKEITREFQAVVTSGGRGLMAANQFPDQSVVHLSLGEDVAVSPIKAYQWSTPFRERLACLRMRQGVFHVRDILINYEAAIKTLYRLKAQRRIFLWGFPEDVERNRARVDQPLLAKLTEQYAKYDRVFVWLSRLNFLQPDIPDYKGPEKFLEAFERLIRNDGPNVRAIIGAHGFDAKAFQQLVKDKGLDPYVEYVSHLPFRDLMTYLSIPNAIVFDKIFDKRGVGLSGMMREALSVGAILVKTADTELADRCYGPGCPVVPARNAEMAYTAMKELLDDNRCAQVRQNVNTWAQAYLHHPRNTRRLLEHLQTIHCASTFA